jgi:hypothetical protein
MWRHGGGVGVRPQPWAQHLCYGASNFGELRYTPPSSRSTPVAPWCLRATSLFLFTTQLQRLLDTVRVQPRWLSKTEGVKGQI